ncbi:MAG TPA: rhomboid family intramembrane serine protease [Polyangiaceae bacterium]
MLPIGDRNPTRTTPFVNYALLAVNAAVFVGQALVMYGGGEAWLVPGYGLVPTRVMNDPAGEAFTFLTSMFMHGSWLHLGGNMLFLYIFGDNVEDAVGHVRYLFFYLACGFWAGVAQIVTDTASTIPMVGASGAIAGVLGAYMVLFPRAPITVLNPPPLWFLGFFIVLPAWVVVGLWFLFNLLSGVSTLGGIGGGGVAFFAHLGGFVAGLLLVRPFHAGRPRLLRDPWQGWRPPVRSSSVGRWS